ncbi:hypothetical protein ACOKFD_11980 [Flagellimonas sp. S174]|uniref:hypothetical protein n=1 Tax=Flagellimonas sp. S174 TaxID=3410790 RepID=UPI003BF54B1C
MSKDFLEYYRASSRAEKKLSDSLGLIWDKSIQDWDLVNSNQNRIDDFLRAYQELDDDDEKFVLMQLIVASFDDFQSEENFDFKLWNECSIVLEKEHSTHIHTISYWSLKENESDHFFLSPFMEVIFRKVIYHYQ